MCVGVCIHLHICLHVSKNMQTHLPVNPCACVHCLSVWRLVCKCVCVCVLLFCSGLLGDGTSWEG